MMPSPSQLPFFFIIGRPRSGTTMLRSMMDAHPEICVSLESAFIKNLYPKYGKIKNWDKARMETFYLDLTKQPKFNFWAIQDEDLKTALFKLPPNTDYASVCKTVYLTVVSFYKKSEIKIIADKNPPYTLYIPSLIKIFPEAKFIYIVRDYRDNVLSMMNVDFEKPWLPSLAYRWRYYNKKFLQAYRRNPEKFHIIKYENLVSQTEKSLRKICTFMGVPYHEQMPAYNQIKEDAYKVYPKDLIDTYHSSLFKPVTSSKVEGWKVKMNKKDIQKCDFIVGKYAERMGYKKQQNLTNTWSLFISCLPGIIYGRAYYLLFDLATILLPYRIRQIFFRILSSIFKPWWKKNAKVVINKEVLKRQ